MALPLRETICRTYELPRTDQVLQQRARLLTGEQRDLLEAVVLSGQPIRRVARMKGITPRAVRWRLHRLARRMNSPRFRQVLHAGPYLPPEDVHVAKRRFCQGVSLHDLAEELDISLHALRRRLDRITAQMSLIADGIAGRRRGAPSETLNL
ncbi:MAG: hypothetical protein ACOC8F_04865 [Planctomycetota bacterium]